MTPAKRGFLGLDVGGTGVKVGVYDAAGRQLSFRRVSLKPAVLGGGMAEMPIESIYRAARAACRGAIAESGVSITALAVSSQGQTFAPFDAQGRSLYPAIMWYDSRAATQAKALAQRVQALSKGTEALPSIQTICSAAKVLWLREHHPAALKRARYYLLLPEFFTFRLTGNAVTDFSTAASSGLSIDGRLEWHGGALQAADITAEQLARIQLPGTPIGTVLPGMARDWGLSPDTLVVTGTNDQYAGALGAGNCEPGIVSEASGTCLGMVTLTRQVPTGLPAGIFPGCFALPGLYFALAYAKTAGLVLKWFMHAFAPRQSYSALDAAAAVLAPGADGLTAFPHFDGRVSPHPDATARGVFAGVTLAHTRVHFYRAILESLTFCERENLELMQRAGLHLGVIRCIGGGAQNEFWMQMKADVTGIPVEKPRVPESAGLGAAMLAAAGAGHNASPAAVSKACYRAEKVFRPRPALRRAYDTAYERYRDLQAKLYPLPASRNT